MATQPNPALNGTSESSTGFTVRVDYRASSAIRQLTDDERTAVRSALDLLAQRGLNLPGMVRVLHLPRSDGQRGLTYELRVPGARDVLMFVRREDSGKALAVVDVLRRTTLQSAARSF